MKNKGVDSLGTLNYSK